MDGNNQVMGEHNKIQQDMDEIGEIVGILHEMFTNPCKHNNIDAQLSTTIQYTWLMSKIIGFHANAIDSWLLDMVSMEFDNWYEESAITMQNMVHSMGKYMKWGEMVKNM